MKNYLSTIIACLIVIPFVCQAEQSQTSREAIWKNFHEVRFRKFGKFQDIRIYGESHDSTKICYISGDQIYTFHYKNNEEQSVIKSVASAKAIFPSKINRITWSKQKRLDGNDHYVFNLWYYEKLELTIN